MAVKKTKKTLIVRFKNLAVVSLLCYAIVILVSQQVQLSEKKQQNAEIKAKVIQSQRTNDDYDRLLSITDEKVYMENYAIERLGYAYPNETRYYTSRN